MICNFVLLDLSGFYLSIAFMDQYKYPLVLDGGLATELERSFGKDLSGRNKAKLTNDRTTWMSDTDARVQASYGQHNACKMIRTRSR